MEDYTMNLLNIKIDIRSILSDNVSCDIQMADAMLTGKENDKLTMLLQEVSTILLSGIKRKLYSMNDLGINND